MDFVTEDLKAFVVELAEEAHHFKAFNHLFFSCYPKNIGGSMVIVPANKNIGGSMVIVPANNITVSDDVFFFFFFFDCP